MRRFIFGLVAGFAVAALLRSEPALEPPERASTTAATSAPEVRDPVDRRSEPPTRIGIPPSSATQIPPKDSLPARRQAVSRTLRDLANRPPADHELDAYGYDPEAVAQFTEAMRAALEGDQEGDLR